MNNSCAATMRNFLVAAVLLISAPALAAGLFTPEINSGALSMVAPESSWTSDVKFQDAGVPSKVDATVTPKRITTFGEEGSWRVNLLAGYMNNLDGIQSEQVLLGFSWFCLSGFSVDAQLNGQYFQQDISGNTGGGGADILFRWHFVRRDTFSVYLDGGFGMVFTGSDVPSGGATMNFTPQAGAGLTFAPDPSADWRIMAGVRWYHLSNARTGSGNPGLNGVQCYAGITLPF
ncbi:MAG: acyloxyacyl hydrolase [Phycisphaerales bacterium]|nr:acyloxyacyl hydrolase [Phycisphaerales bacterium]